MGNRGKVRCTKCGSLERTRALKIQLDKNISKFDNLNILHFAPERGLYEFFKNASPSGYDAVDYSPELFPGLDLRKFDIVSDCETLSPSHYDIIIHSHVLEHIPCNIAYFFFHAARTLKKDGTHIFCIPILSGYYDEYFGPLPTEERIRRFGQDDHVRRFGVEDIRTSLGKIVRLPQLPSHYNFAYKDELDRHNIPAEIRSGFNSHTIFSIGKEDYLLQ